MFDSIGSMPMQGMRQVNQSRPPMPSPDEMMDKGIERLEENINSGKIDTEEVATKLVFRF